MSYIFKFSILSLIIISLPGHTIDASKVMGPDECTECHDVENSIWENTHHFNTYENMPEQDEANSIAEKLGIDDVIESETCQSCHLTLQESEGEKEVIAGVTCESCHGAGKEWMEIHSEEDKTPEQAKQLWAQSEAAGMIRPGNLIQLAGNCLDCHLVKNEKLVNIAEHTPGSEFNLVTWSQGEIRHNTFHSENGENRKATAEKQRKMLIIGSTLELQRAILAHSDAKQVDGKYAKEMAKRIEKTKKQITEFANSKASPLFDELNNVAKSAPAKDMVGNKSIAKQLSTVLEKIQSADAKSWQALDAIIKSLGESKGEAQE